MNTTIPLIDHCKEFIEWTIRLHKLQLLRAAKTEPVVALKDQ